MKKAHNLMPGCFAWHMSPIPGWYKDPQDASQLRYWDGVSWSEQTRSVIPPTTPPIQPSPQISSNTGKTPTWLKVMLVCALVVAALIGGCAGCGIILGESIKEGVQQLEQDAQKHAVTDAQMSEVKLGMSRAQVIDILGPPYSQQQQSLPQVGDVSCIYYPVKGEAILNQWQLCFNQQGKLDSKIR